MYFMLNDKVDFIFETSDLFHLNQMLSLVCLRLANPKFEIIWQCFVFFYFPQQVMFLDS